MFFLFCDRSDLDCAPQTVRSGIVQPSVTTMKSAFLACAMLSALLLARPAGAFQLVEDIPYRLAENNWEQKFNNLDVYAPDDAANCPVVVYVHGGGWVSGDKSFVYAHPQFFSDNGVVYVSVNHRVSSLTAAQPHVYPVHPSDVAEALAWVATHIGDHGGDPDKVFLTGHSSGAHLAALISVDGSYLASAGVKAGLIKGTILFDGGDFDFVARYPTLSDIGLANFNLVFGTNVPPGDWNSVSAEDKAIWLEASPIEYVLGGGTFGDFLFLKAGTRDGTQPDDMASAIADNTASAATVWVAVGKTHGSVSSDLGEPGDPINGVVLDFIANTLTRQAEEGGSGPTGSTGGGAGTMEDGNSGGSAGFNARGQSPVASGCSVGGSRHGSSMALLALQCLALTSLLRRRRRKVALRN